MFCSQPKRSWVCMHRRADGRAPSASMRRPCPQALSVDPTQVPVTPGVPGEGPYGFWSEAYTSNTGRGPGEGPYGFRFSLKVW